MSYPGGSQRGWAHGKYLVSDARTLCLPEVASVPTSGEDGAFYQ